MIEIAVDRDRRVLWASFPGTFTHEDLGAIDQVSNTARGLSSKLDYVFDFSENQGTGAVFRQEFLQRSQRPHPISAMRRVIVAPSDAIRELARLFSAAQAMIGSSAPVVVRSGQEARDVLGYETLELERVEIGALTDLLRA